MTTELDDLDPDFDPELDDAPEDASESDAAPLSVTLGDEDGDDRLDRVLAGYFEDISRARLQALIDSVATPPRQRRATRPTYASKVRRLEGKRQRSDVKAGRGRHTGTD